MGLFSFRPTRQFFTEEEKQLIVQAIRTEERRTSGEIRVFVESKCRFVNPVDRAIEVFRGLNMEKTEHRNGVLIYLATRHRQLAIFGDEGIHKKLGEAFWNEEVSKMLKEFNADRFADGVIGIVHDIGNALYQHFPYDRADKNELPDDIVFGQ